MIVHIMPTYLCNNNCQYCYLGKLKTSKDILPLPTTRRHLEIISEHYSIDCINLYGGEITLLPYEYISSLIDTAKEYCTQVSVTSNMKAVRSWKIIDSLFRSYPDLKIATSINEERPNNEELVNKLLTEKVQKLGITQVVTPSLLKKSPSLILAQASMLGRDMEFLRYSPGGEDIKWKIGTREFETFMIQILTEFHSRDYNINIKNEEDIINCLEKNYNPFADSNIFLEPNGAISTIAYTSTGKEYFKKINQVKEIDQIVTSEKKAMHDTCNGCRYINHCYAEHINFAKGEDCCGCRQLLKYYEENLYKNN